MQYMKFLASALLLFLPAASGQRALHWVIRVSNLEETLHFVQLILGMKVLRHEENEAACPLTCNGKFDTPWSKTMVGYGPEDTNYALELTYNYGIDNYNIGEGLQRFVIHVPGEPSGNHDVLVRARDHGYVTNGSVVTGPDGYTFELLGPGQGGEKRAEPFERIVLRASDPVALAEWYMENLGMTVLAKQAAAVTIGFGGQREVQFIIEHSNPAPRITQWEGRSAFALPADRIRTIYAKVQTESPHLIVHDMRELQEKLGTLFIVILRDPAGYEICLVSSETFDPSVREATNYKGPDWKFRADAFAAITAKASPVHHDL